MGAGGEGGLEEAKAMGDLRGGVDVERGAVLFGKSGEADSVAVEGAVAIGEGASGWNGLYDWRNFLRQVSSFFPVAYLGKLAVWCK